MKPIFTFLFSAVLCALVSCNGSEVVSKTVDSVEKTDSCLSNTANSYEVYIPARVSVAEKLPLLLIIDSHGSGKFALEKFKHGADNYPAVLIASNQVKNGFAGYETAIQSLITDARQKYPIGETVFIAGFSGGARMALGYALVHHVNGLILCGALANPDQLNAVGCPVISISGMDDFNFLETAQYLFHEQRIPRNLKIELTSASHAWPDSSMLANAAGFLGFASQTEPNPEQIEQFCKYQHVRIDRLQENGDLLKAALVALNMSTTEAFKSDNSFAAIYRELTVLPAYTSQLSQLENCLKQEMNARQPYIEAFQTKDSLWWKNEIRLTDKKIETETDVFRKDMYRRIRGFWGIASYSLSKQAINGHNADALNRVLSVYRALEPENPDMFYFSAFIYLWKGNDEETISMLKRALNAGFSDMEQLNNDFPANISSKF